MSRKSEVRQSKYQTLRTLKDYLESLPVVQNYSRFLLTTSSEKAEMYKKWDEYYELCRNTRASKLVFEIKESIEKHNQTKTQTLLAENMSLIEDSNFLPRPRLYDPYELTNNPNVRKYLNAVNRLREMDGEGYVPGNNLEEIFVGRPYKDD